MKVNPKRLKAIDDIETSLNSDLFKDKFEITYVIDIDFLLIEAKDSESFLFLTKVKDSPIPECFMDYIISQNLHSAYVSGTVLDTFANSLREYISEHSSFQV